MNMPPSSFPAEDLAFLRQHGHLQLVHLAERSTSWQAAWDACPDGDHMLRILGRLTPHGSPGRPMLAVLVCQVADLTYHSLSGVARDALREAIACAKGASHHPRDYLLSLANHAKRAAEAYELVAQDEDLHDHSVQGRGRLMMQRKEANQAAAEAAYFTLGLPFDHGFFKACPSLSLSACAAQAVAVSVLRSGPYAEVATPEWKEQTRERIASLVRKAYQFAPALSPVPPIEVAPHAIIVGHGPRQIS